MFKSSVCHLAIMILANYFNDQVIFKKNAFNKIKNKLSSCQTLLKIQYKNEKLKSVTFD